MKDVNSKLLEAADKGDAKTLKNLIVREADVNSRDSKGSTPLHYSCEKGHTEVVKCLIIAEDNTEIAEILREAGAKEQS